MINNLNPYPKQIFVYGSNTRLGEEIAKLLEVPLSPHTTKSFPNGERISHQNITVRGKDVYIIFTSLNGGETDKWIVDYLRFARAVKHGQPHKITAVMPKLLHQRQDVENRELRQPKLSDFFPELLKTAGVDRMVVCKLHNPASCTSNPPMENVDTTKLIIENIRSKFSDLSNVAVASGDMGGSKYSRKIAEELRVPLIITDKDRDPRTGKTRAMKVYTQGDISENIDTVIFVDDLISTFTTLRQAGDALHKEQTQIVNYCAIATHADFSEETVENIIQSEFSSVWVTDTVPVGNDFVSAVQKAGKSIVFISVAKLIAQTIDNLHNGESVSALWTKNGQI
ncbi:MAG TPA: ribose-phosphate diphosphokinase [Candidatus Paceibacterota bacterium]|jgi:ribose-phosphate pyrophosphokinase|nr:ribose-phosphate diphosphokinase [Candidatus Paceibacterota bacterium]